VYVVVVVVVAITVVVVEVEVVAVADMVFVIVVVGGVIPERQYGPRKVPVKILMLAAFIMPEPSRGSETPFWGLSAPAKVVQVPEY
jgi:hypothetical protein